MLRSIQLIAAIGVVIVLAVVVGVSWRDQEQLARRIDEVAVSLGALTTAAKEAADAAELYAAVPEVVAPVPSTVSLSGVAYLDEPSRPAVDFPLTLQTVGGDYKRIVWTDSEGRFDSGDLPPGRYQAMFFPIDANGDAANGLFVFYSDEFDLSNGGDEAEAAFDVLQLDSGVRFEFSSPPPELIVRDERYRLLPHAYLVTYGEDERAPDGIFGPEASEKKRPLAGANGRLHGFSHRRWRNPSATDGSEFVEVHLDALASAGQIASGRYALFFTVSALRLNHPLEFLSQQGVSNIPHQVFPEMTLQVIEVTPGEQLTVVIEGLDVESLLLSEEEKQRLSNAPEAYRTRFTEGDQYERERLRLGMRTVDAQSIQTTIRRDR